MTPLFFKAETPIWASPEFALSGLMMAGLRGEQEMKSKPYKLNGKLFRYDFDHCLVEHIIKAGAEEIADNAEWMQKHGRPLLDIDADGYMVISTVGLGTYNWKKKALRDEYLSEWCCDLDEESATIIDDFVKYELPYLTGGEAK